MMQATGRAANGPMRETAHAFEVGSRITFGIVAFVLALFAVRMTLYGVGQTLYALIYWLGFNVAVLTGVGCMGTSIAVFEVAK